MKYYEIREYCDDLPFGRFDTFQQAFRRALKLSETYGPLQVWLVDEMVGERFVTQT